MPKIIADNSKAEKTNLCALPCVSKNQLNQPKRFQTSEGQLPNMVFHYVRSNFCAGAWNYKFTHLAQVVLSGNL